MYYIYKFVVNMYASQHLFFLEYTILTAGKICFSPNQMTKVQLLLTHPMMKRKNFSGLLSKIP